LQINAEDSVLEGNNLQFTTSLYPYLDGTYTWSLESGRAGCTIDQNGLLTTEETALDTSDVVVKVTFVANDGEVLTATKTVSVVRRTYPQNIVINGASDPRESAEYTWSHNTEGVNGEYSVVWSLEGSMTSYWRIASSDSQRCVLEKTGPMPNSVSGTLKVSIVRESDKGVASVGTLALSLPVVFPADATIIGNVNPLEKPYTYTWETTTEGVNGEFYAEWILSGDVISVVEIASSDNESCTMRMLDAVTELVDGLLTLNIRKSYDGTLMVSTTKELQALLEGVIMTSKTNPLIQAALYSNGLVANETYTFKEEAALITASQLKNALTNIPGMSHNTLTQFDEFQYFTGVTEILSNTFHEFYNLSSIVIPSSVTKIDSYNFRGLKTVKIPSNVVTIGASAFSGNTKLTEVEFSEGLLTIGYYAFNSCSKLNSVNFPSTLTAIDDFAFYSCSSLSSIKGGSGLTFVGMRAFQGISELATIEDTFPYSLVIHNVGIGLIIKGTSIYDLSSGQILAYKHGIYAIDAPNGVFYADETSTKEITLQYTGLIQNLTDFLKIGYFTVRISSNISEATFDVSYTNVENENVSVTLGVGEYVLPIKVNSTVTCTPTEDYNGFTTPQAKSASAGARISFGMLYEELLGVYIQHIDGTLYTKEDWVNEGFSNDLANGVAIAGAVTGEGFVVGKEDLNTIDKYRWYNGSPSLVAGVLATTSSSAAILDMKGLQNTSLLTGNHDVAYICSRYTFPNGNKGYLPAMGELHLLYQNVDVVEDLMKTIGGSVFKEGEMYWSSTQVNDKRVWTYYLNSKYSDIASYSKNNDIGETRPFTTYKQ
jgi:hypothetical protein